MSDSRDLHVNPPWRATPMREGSNAPWQVVGRSPHTGRDVPVALWLSEENARLIARAPEMKDALERIEEEAGENADVVDGPNGPLPDRDMRIQTMAKEGLGLIP